jgi:hypothetical protein
MSDPLDDILSQATWPEPAAKAVGRLEATWDELRSPARWRIGWRVAAALAAVIVICFAAVSIIDRRPKPVIAVSPAAPAPAVNVARPESPASTSMRVAGRDVSDVELLVLHAKEKQLRRQQAAAVAPAPPPDPTRARAFDVRTLTSAARAAAGPERRHLIATLLDRHSADAVMAYLELLNDPAIKADALAALDQVTKPPTDRLLATLDGPRADLRVAAALALGRIDGPVTTRRLIDRVAADRNKREAMLALASSRGADAQAFMRKAAASDELAALAQSAIAQAEIH